MIVRLPNPMIVAVWLAFFLPSSLWGGLADRAFGVAVLLVGGAVLFTQPSPWEARKPSARALKIFLLLEIFCVVSYVYSAAFNGIQFGPRDAFELLRCVVLGTFVVYLIRHYDESVRAAMEWAMAAALYFFLVCKAADPQGYVSVLTLCYLLFFSRLRLRYLHAAAAVLAVSLNGGLRSWTAAWLVVSAALCVLLYRELVRRRVKLAARSSLLLGALLLAGPALCFRSSLAAPQPRSYAEMETLQMIRRSPVFGWGRPEDAEIAGVSQYLSWMLTGGALGAGLILAGLGLAGYRLLRAASGDLERHAGAAAFLGSVALMLGSWRFLDGFRLFFLTSFFAAGIHEASR